MQRVWQFCRPHPAHSSKIRQVSDILGTERAEEQNIVNVAVAPPAKMSLEGQVRRKVIPALEHSKPELLQDNARDGYLGY